MIFIFPTELEASPFRKACPDANVVICGVGMAATAATLCEIDNDQDIIILAGIAGSYDTTQNPVNKVVEVISEQIEELPEQFSKVYRLEPRWGLPTVSSNTVNSSNFRGAKSDIENMEGAAAAAICLKRNMRLSEIRAVSNYVGDPIEKWSIKSALSALTNTLSTIYHG